MIAPQVNIFSFVLEDDPDVLEQVEAILKGNNIESYRLFHTPEQFLQNITADIHVCLLDHYLSGGLTGLDILREVKKRSADSFVIIMSGQQSMDIVVQYLNECADRYIDKNKPDYLQKLELYLTKGLDESKARLEEITFLMERKKERDKVFKKLDLG